MKGFTRMETRFSLCGLNCDWSRQPELHYG